MSAATRVDLDARYGRRGPRRTVIGIAVVAGVLLIAGGVWVAWIGLFAPSGQVEAQTIGYTRIDDGVRIRAEVSGPPGRALGCAFEADAEDGTVIGWRTVTLPASGERTRRITVDVRVTAPVYTGLINRCWLT